MATKSIGATGRDYATLALWAAYVNALALSAPEIGEMYNDAEFVLSANVTLSGWTGGSGTNTVTLKCATGQSFRDNANKATNALRYNQANGVGVRCAQSYTNAITITGSFFRMDGLQVYVTDNSSQSAVNQQGAGDGTANAYTNCIFQTASNRNTFDSPAIQLTDGSITNCAVLSRGNAWGIEPSRNSAQCSITDCTVVSSNSSTGSGINSSYTPGVIITNTVVSGFATDYAGAIDASSTNNATDKSSFGVANAGTNGQVSIVGATEWVKVTLNSEDLRLKSTSVKLNDNGATSGPANDIVGTTRSAPYDIGCWEGLTAPAPPAWEIVGVSNVVTVTTSSHALVTTGISGLQAGDLLVACISSRIASTTSITLPSGGAWTLVSEQKNNNVLTTTSAVASGMMAYCVRGASDPNLTFTHPTTPSVAMGRIVAYRNVNQVTPKDTQTSFTTAVNTTAVSGTGLTTANDNELIVAMAAGGQEDTWSSFNATSPSVASGATDTTTNPTTNTWIERADSSTTTGADTSLGIFDGLKGTAGVTGNLTVTASLGAGHVVVAGAFKFVGGITTNRSVNLTSAETAALIRSAGKRVNVADASALSVQKAVSHALSFLEPNTLRLTKGNPRTINVTSPETLTALHLLSHFVNLVTAESVSLARAVSKTIRLTTTAVVQFIKQALHPVALVTAQALTNQRQSVKVVNNSNANTLSLRRQAGKLVALVDASAVTVLRAVSHAVSFTSAQVFTAVRQATCSMALASSQVLSLVAVRGGLTRLMTLVQTQNLSILRQVGVTRSLASPNVLSRRLTALVSVATVVVNNVRLSRAAAHLISLTNAQAASLQRLLSRLASLATPNVLSLQSASAGVVRTFSLASTQVLSLTRRSAFLRLVSLSQASSLSVVRAATRLLAFTTPSQLTLQRLVLKTLAFSHSNVLSLTSLRVTLRTYALQSAQTLRLTRTAGRLIQLTSAATLTTSRVTSRLVGLAQAQVVSLQRQVRHAVALASTNVLSVARGFARVVGAASANVLSLIPSAITGPHVIVGLLSAQTVTVRKQVSKRVSMTGASVLSLAHQTFAAIVTITLHSSASLSLAFRKVVIDYKRIVRAIPRIRVATASRVRIAIARFRKRIVSDE